jgi:hypothetical protein
MKKKPVTTEEAEETAKRIGAVTYIECSAKSKFRVNDVFVAAAKATMSKEKTKELCINIELGSRKNVV